eukprot:gene21804-biopygen19202
MGSGPYNSPWGARGHLVDIGRHMWRRRPVWEGPLPAPPPPTRPRYSLRARPT